jgi:tetratricopeptide (TPR) repeat protein
LALAACRSRPPYRAPAAAFYNGHPQGAYEAIAADGDRGIPPEDEALWRNELSVAAICSGKEEAALRSLRVAGGIMGTLSSTSTENARAIFGEESTKTYRGDPYERCMNAFYKGLLYYRRGDLDRASASFKRGLLADAWSASGEHQRDFAALSFMLGWVSHRRGKLEQARYSFKEAATHAPHNPHLADPRPEENNVLIVANLGVGPVKFRDGPHGSVARFRRRDYPEAGVAVFVDGVRAGESAEATDLYIQAITRGKRVLDGIRSGKAVFKTGTYVAGQILLYDAAYSRKQETGQAFVALGLLLASALTRAEADVRHWDLLPGEIHVLPLSLTPGRHSIEVRVLGESGDAIAGWHRTFDVEVAPGGDTLYYFRTGPRRSIYGLVDAPGPSKAEPLPKLGFVTPGMSVASSSAR